MQALREGLMSKNTAIVTLFIVGHAAILLVVFGAIYLTVNYSALGLLLLLLIFPIGAEIPSTSGIRDVR